ncbi:MAG: DUF996 domain-containing protein [Candidatus Verstraetearchaeota archaeon]|nr:DUF996 domain-containing protein [Candidatus Verstraetearchaeota archaeon]
MNFESNKTLGGLGAVLMFLGAIPIQYFGFLSIVGLILLIIALHGLAEIYKERGIFNNFMYGVAAGIVGGVIAAALIIVTVLTTLTTLLYQIFPGWNGDWYTLSSLTPDLSNITPGDFMPLIGGMLSVFAIIWVALIISSFFVRRSMNSLSAKTGVGLFSTAGLLLIVGAFLAIVLIGFLVIWIAILLIAIAFFQIKTQPDYSVATPQPQPPPPT